MKIITSLIALTTVSLATTSLAADQNTATEKCYGIVKAGKNDCQTSTDSCAGSATADNQGDAFLFLPKGVCEKIVGGSLTALDQKATNKK